MLSNRCENCLFRLWLSADRLSLANSGKLSERDGRIRSCSNQAWMWVMGLLVREAVCGQDMTVCIRDHESVSLGWLAESGIIS